MATRTNFEGVIQRLHYPFETPFLAGGAKHRELRSRLLMRDAWYYAWCSPSSGCSVRPGVVGDSTRDSQEAQSFPDTRQFTRPAAHHMAQAASEALNFQVI